MENKKPEKKHTHTLIISDLHLGSSVSQPGKVLKFLKSYSFRKLILLGDIFDSLDFRNLGEDALELINYIGHISDEKKVRWIIGNHDEHLAETFGPLMNAKVYEVYHWHFEKKKYLAIHGHQFDRFLINNAFLSYLATRIYNFIQNVDGEKNILSHFLKRKSKGWLRLSEKVSRSALRYAKRKKADFVFCGHTHKAMEKTSHGIKYYNSGCWTDVPECYITIDHDDIRIRRY